MKRVRRSAKGLFLWRVKLSGNDPDLWITTPTRSLEIVAKKAKIVINRDRYSGKIVAIEDEGIIDA